MGKRTEANKKARRLIAEKCEELGLERCEIRFPGCMDTFGVAPAHRHKRDWYSGNVEKLADYNEWVCACQFCHDRIEVSRELTEETFKRLRPLC